MPRGGRSIGRSSIGHHSIGHSSTIGYRASYGRYHSHHGGGGGGAIFFYRGAPLGPRLLTPSQAALEEATEEYASYYTPRSCGLSCAFGVGVFFSLVSFALTLACILTPWHYLGGDQPVAGATGSSGRYWGIAVYLYKLVYTSSYISTADSSSDLDYWFGDSKYGASTADFSTYGLSPAPLSAALALCALALVGFLALFYGQCSDFARCRARPGPAANLDASLGLCNVLLIKLCPAVLVLAGSLVGTHGLPAASILKAVGSPAPGVRKGPGSDLATAAPVLAFAVVALEAFSTLATCAHARRRRLLGLPLQPPPLEAPQPTALEQRALAQGRALLASGTLSLHSPAKPTLPEDLRAYKVVSLAARGSSGVGEEEAAVAAAAAAAVGDGVGALDLYHCRVRLYSGEELRENAAPLEPSAPSQQVRVPLVLASAGSYSRLEIVLGESGSVELPVAAPGLLLQGGIPRQLQAVGSSAAAAAAAGAPLPSFGGVLPEGAASIAQPSAQAAPPGFCTQCGTPLVSGAHFCAHCGHQVGPL